MEFTILRHIHYQLNLSSSVGHKIFSVGFRSNNCAGQSKTIMLFYQNHACTEVNVSFGSSVGIFAILPQISIIFLELSNIISIMCRGTNPLRKSKDKKQHHHCFTIGITFMASPFRLYFDYFGFGQRLLCSIKQATNMT